MESQIEYPQVQVVKLDELVVWVDCCYCGKYHGHIVPESGVHFRTGFCDLGEYWFTICKLK